MYTTLRERKFGFYLVLSMSILVTFVMLTTTAYFIFYIKDLGTEYNENLKRSVSTVIINAYSSDVKNKKYVSLPLIVDTLKKNNIVKYVKVVSNKTGNTVWGSEEKESPELLFNTNIVNLKFPLPKTTLYVGFINNTLQSKTAESAVVSMRFFVFDFLVLSFIFSILIANGINRPIVRLLKGVTEFTKGNLNYRIKKTELQEINQLIEAYNDMAQQLQELYSSLEQKVQERTIALENINEQLKQTQAMMVHSEKMRSLGELVAGIAHEINNPINFIYGNIIHLERYSNDLLNLIKLYSEADEFIPQEKREELQQIKQDIDIEFLNDDIKDLIKSCKEGTERTKNIVLDLKNFSRIDGMSISEFNIQKEIDTTLNILHNKYKNRINVHINCEEDMPMIEAFGGQLNQVFMNILDNAQYAIKGEGDLYIDINKQGSNAVIKFRDTGVGMSKESIQKVFEPFFTTKPVGEGTGLGMSIAYRVIQNHHGKIDIQSEIGKGTTFIITLPLKFEKED